MSFQIFNFISNQFNIKDESKIINMKKKLNFWVTMLENNYNDYINVTKKVMIPTIPLSMDCCIGQWCRCIRGPLCYLPLFRHILLLGVEEGCRQKF